MARRMVILTEGQTDPLAAKTAASLVRYCREEVVALLDRTQAGRTAGELLAVGDDLPIVGSLDDAPPANTLAIGIAPPGGRLPDAWREIVLDALRRGMDVLSGLHDFLSDDEVLAAAARAAGGRIVDVRRNRQRQIARQIGLRPDCLRIHTIGHDCSCGKMVAALELARGLQAAGHDAKFLATGQTGIMISGGGVPIDCVVADFVNGAAERLVLENQRHDILLIEGQGSLFHPSYSGVTAGLLHGCLPHGLILCYEAGRTAVRGLEHVPLPTLSRVREVYESLAAAMCPARVIGAALNGRLLDDRQALRERQRAERELGLPVCDLFRDGPGPLIEAVLAMRADILGAMPPDSSSANRK